VEAFLPASAESTRVLQLQRNFGRSQAVPLSVVYVRHSGPVAGAAARPELAVTIFD
jgi:hypothetical protein